MPTTAELESSINSLAKRLQAGDQSVEPAYVETFEYLADRLLLDDAKGFAALVASAGEVPLVGAFGQQLRHYFDGLALRVADRYGEALEVFDGLLANLALDERVRGRALNSRAVCYRLTGRLEAALDNFGASLELWRRLGDTLREGLALYNQGIIRYQLQEYGLAEDLLRQAVICFEEADSAKWLAAAQNELGLLYRDEGLWGEALGCFTTAFQYYREAKDAQEALGSVLNNIGEVLFLEGRVREAQTQFQEALAVMGARATNAVDTYLYLGLTHQVLGNLSDAHATFQTALELAVGLGRRDILAEVHYRLGEALRRQGDGQAALVQFEAGAEVIEAIRQPLHDEGLKISLLGRWQQVYEAVVLQALALGRPAEAFNWAERARARAFAETTGAKGRHSAKESSPTGPVTADEVCAGLPENSALLCYFTTGVLDREMQSIQSLAPASELREHLLTPARTLLFVIVSHDLACHECPIDPNAFAVASPRQEDRGRFLTPTALHHMYAALLQPAAEALAVGSLFIVPHGPLHRVPFGALTDAGGQSLTRRGGPRIAYAPSATVLLQRLLAPAQIDSFHSSCLAVGYDGAATQSGPRLRHTEAEAKFVANITGGEAWVGPDPKRERLQAAAGERRWLHFACHGWFNYDDPLESYLETSLGERVTALDILADWNLRADLVTLSACQTGVSRVLRSDEPMGLIRAFLSAGAKAVLVTQWPVEDLPTFLLMNRFYEELFRGQRAGSALQQAQLWLRELTLAEAQQLLSQLNTAAPLGGLEPWANLALDAHPFSLPRHWAALTLIGDC